MVIVRCGRRSRIRLTTFLIRSTTTALLLLLPPRPGGRKLSSPRRLVRLRRLVRASCQDQRKSEGESGHAPMMLLSDAESSLGLGTAGDVRGAAGRESAGHHDHLDSGCPA